MNAGELCNREVVFAYRNTPLVEAARLMREHHVGSLVVVVDRLSERVPVGILTDRDIVVAVVAKELDPRGLTVGDVVTGELIAVREKDGMPDALRLMREKGVRRVPVLTHSGALAGILTIDDLLDLMAEELGALARTINRERVRETRARR
ncbi:MAG: histidine kinase [Betaproteobacteria bacterium RBG_16_66_20]|nr:MAG: histidine kinase [Betaproteobacteria bacterium RBG_16_66_20]